MNSLTASAVVSCHWNGVLHSVLIVKEHASIFVYIYTQGMPLRMIFCVQLNRHSSTLLRTESP